MDNDILIELKVLNAQLDELRFEFCNHRDNLADLYERSNREN